MTLRDTPEAETQEERDALADAELIGYAQDARDAVMLHALASLYVLVPEEVAELCDGRLDTSGRLLGRVRALSSPLSPVPPKEEKQ